MNPDMREFRRFLFATVSHGALASVYLGAQAIAAGKVKP
jgi:hypothetical protein